jgi:hypothetical protein
MSFQTPDLGVWPVNANQVSADVREFFYLKGLA